MCAAKSGLITLYWVCFEVNKINQSINQLSTFGAAQWYTVQAQEVWENFEICVLFNDEFWGTYIKIRGDTPFSQSASIDDWNVHSQVLLL